MDNKLSKCICSNVDRFDTKSFLSKHRMSIDYELQLIQTLQCYKEVMLKTQNINDQNLKNNLSNSNSSSSLSEHENFGNLDDENEDENDSNFDLFHVTTPRSKCIRFETMIDRIYDRYNLHTTQTSNYSKLRKKQQRIESFYKDKVADKHSIALLVANNEKMHFLTNWNSGKRGLKTMAKSEKNSSNISDESSAMILNIESKPNQNENENEEFEQSNVQQTEIEDADDELLSEEDDDEQSEDDSDASMDSDTLNRILFESSQQTQKRQKNHTNVSKKSVQNKPKNVMKKGAKKSKKVSKKETKNVTYASLKPPASNQKKKKKNSQKKKKKRKQFKKRKKYIPRFMQTKKSKSATPRKAHKMKLCDMNDSDNDGSKKKFKGMRVKKRTHSKSYKVTKVAENSFDILYVDREIKRRRSSVRDGLYQKRIQIGKASQSDVGVLGSEYFGSLHSPQYLRLKSKNGEAKMVPMRVLDFGKDDC